MAFEINFKANKPQRAANQNFHDDAAWGFAYEFAQTFKPINEWPLQYAVHYVYEYINRPWLPDRFNIEELVAWMQNHKMSQSIKI